MWKKEAAPEPVTSAGRAEAAPRPERTPAPKVVGERATIGRSITIRGEVTGDEDLLIQGRVEGSVDLKQHSVTVGREGEVKADIVARIVTVEGTVDGNISADEQVVLRSSALVQGDIGAPRVVLEDGARFRGGVDMGEVRSSKGNSAGASARGSSAAEATRQPAEAMAVAGGKSNGSTQKPAEATS